MARRLSGDGAPTIPSSGAPGSAGPVPPIRIDEARRALPHLPADRFTEPEVLSLRAWFAARQGQPDAERAALEQLIDQVPGDTQALERLAVLAAESGQSDRAAELRRRKAEIDRAKERYYRTLEGREPITQYAELAGLAEKLGRGFEARGWWFLASRYQPDDPAAAAASTGWARRPARRRTSARGKTAGLHAGRSRIARLSPNRPRDRPAESTAPGPARRARLAGRVRAARVPRRRRGRGPALHLRQRPVAAPPAPRDHAGGVGLLDYDGDGWLDVYVVQGGAFPARSQPASDAATACSATGATARSRT